MSRIRKFLGRRTSLALAGAATLLVSTAVVAPSSALADNAGPTCRNGADQAEFYVGAGWNRTFNPGGLCLTALNFTRSIFQTDGNFVTYSDTGRALWSSRTSGQGATSLVLQADGNMVIYRGATALWSTHTAGKKGVNGNYLKQFGTGSLDLFMVDAHGNSVQIW